MAQDLESHPGKFGQVFRAGSWVMHVSRTGSSMHYQIGRIESFKSKNLDYYRWEQMQGNSERIRVLVNRPPEVKAYVEFLSGDRSWHEKDYPRKGWVLLDHLIVVDPSTITPGIRQKWFDGRPD